MNHPLAEPYTINIAARRSAAYFSLHDMENANHHYRLCYIDDDDKKHQKEIIVELPAFTDLTALPAEVSKQRPWLLQGTILVSAENLSLKNGLPIPF